MQESSPYLKPGRLGDVIAALQFLGQYDDYKLSVEEWTEKLATMPRSTDQRSWSEVFGEHPEFFRKNDDGLISLVWRRATAKSQEGIRPPLHSETIVRLIDTAIRLHTMAVDARRADENRDTEKKIGMRWWTQLLVSVVTAILAFVGVLLAASIKAEN
jgi:hypothetical protein